MVTALPTLLVGVAHQWVIGTAADHIATVRTAPEADIALVLGASVYRDGTPSPMLRDRLRAAADLFHAGKVPRILVSGDRSAHYDEVLPMARFLEAAGVPAQVIFLDPHGYRTLDSVHRARDVFGVRRLLVVTNPFHVSRAVFLARQAGLFAVGVAAEYGTPYSRSTRVRHEGREVGARVLAALDVCILGTTPRNPTGRVDLTGDGRSTRRP